MGYDDLATRQAFIAGATAAVGAAVLNMPTAEARELEGWLDELSQWTEGEPPDAPDKWV